mgnify:CR=1 FL=1|tara:strand:- start:394 stop:1071 length:678 start_codon:yes stop_codon:yes gene_type:complete
MRFLIRYIHKYLSFFISLQLLLWTISGIFFAFNKIELVRGEQYRLIPNYSFNLSNFDFEIYDAINVKVMKRLGEDILVSKRELNTKYLDIDGKSIAKISSKEAKKIVQDRTTLNPISAEEIIKQKNGSEYRGRELPLYKVLSSDIDDKEINVYLNMYSGEIVAIRSFQWSVWDLMWGFHIMDWQERDDINNLLLKIFSILALLSAITGILLFFKVDINSGVSTDE